MAGEIDDAIERADRESFTRQPPKTLKGQIGFLLKQMGSAKAVARELGVTADSVNRYRRGARKHARADVAAKIDDAVRQRWQPLVRKRRQRQAAASGGITVETRARFGYTAPVGTTDDGRFRRLTVHLPPPTHNASSTPATQAPATTRCARSSPKDSKRSTSRTAAAAPQDSPTSPSTTSTTSTSTTDPTPADGPGACLLSRSAIGVTKAGLLSPRSAAMSFTESLVRRTRSRVPRRADVVGAPEAV